MTESAFAQHIIASIRNELSLLKAHNYIQAQAYDDILRLLPKDVSNRDMASYNNSNPPAFPGGMMPAPSPVQSNMATPPSAVASPPSYNTAASKLGSAEALYDYNGENSSTDLSFRRGDIIQLTELVNDDWWKGSLKGKTGIFPRSYVKKLDSYDEKKTSPPPPPARQNQRDSYGYSPIPPKQSSYNYPPPPQQQNSYGAPPPQSNYSLPPQNSYAPPPQSNSYALPPPQQQVTYAPPPVQQVVSAPVAAEQPHEEGKMSSFGKKLAGNVANAATWGFGATLGSDVAHSIF